MTIGVEFGTLMFRMQKEKVVKLQIWDTAGQESFKSITKIFYRGTQCVILTYDITKPDTLQNCAIWIRELRENCGDDAVVLLVGCQADRSEERQVTADMIERFKQEHQVEHHLETSAKTGENVEEMFILCCQLVYL